MAKLTIHDIEVRGRRVLVRTDLNLPLQRGRVLDDMLVRAALPTITELTSRGARVVLVSHVGRPQGAARAEYRMDPVAARLSKFLGRPVRKVDHVIGTEAERAVAALADGEALLLENVRFHPGESANDPDLARALARLGELFVNDCFATAHHEEASNVGVARLLPSCAGLRLAEEVRRLDASLRVPRHPFVAALGGARIEEKLGAIEGMLGRADAVLLGSGLALPFFAARGLTAGGRQVSTGEIDAARRIFARAEELRTELVLPRDLVVTDNPIVQNQVLTVPAVAIPPDLLVVDIGPETTALYADRIKQALLVVWNAPMGIDEVDAFAAGTLAVAQAVAETEATTLVGGGDTTALVRQACLDDRVVHLSTGGGAFLEYVAGHALPGLAALPERPE
jgi:phosphoglycerate kinase